MATLEELQAELARRQQTQPVSTGISAEDLQAELARRQQVLPSQPLQPSPFPVERGETRAARELPELGTGGLLGGEDAAKIATLSPVLLTTTNDQEIADIITENFPNVGQQVSPAGELILANNKTGTRVIVNRPGISRLDLIQALGIASAFTPAARGAALVAPLAAKAVTGAVTAGLTQAAIEGIQQQVGGQLDEQEIALAGALGGASELVVPAIQAIRQARQARRIGAEAAELPAVSSQVEAARRSTEQIKELTGKEVGLFQAQQTLQPSELIKQRLLPQLDAGSKRAAEALETQNKEVFDATSELIDRISPESTISEGAKRFKTASETALKAANQRRASETSGLFEEALKTGAEVDLKPVKNIINESLKDAVKGKQQSALIKVLKNIKGKEKKGGLIVAETGKPILKPKSLPPTLRQLDNAKDEINAVLETAVTTGVDRKTKRILTRVKRELVSQMENASPVYKTAMDEFRRLSPAVQELEDSILGQVSKIDDVNVKNISQRIFDPKAGLADPSQIKNAKKIIDQVDPGAWDDLLRVELNRRVGALEQLVEDIPGELVGNVPGQLRRAIFGNPSQRNALLSGMTKEQRKNFVFLDDVLRRASAGRAIGSPTAEKLQVIEKLRGISLVLRDVIFRPLEAIQRTGERTLFDRNVRALTEVMFDTRFEKQLKELRKLNPNSPAAARAMSQILKQAQPEKSQNNE